MARCAANNADASPCERIVRASQKYCYAHDPLHQQARSRAASKAARSKKPNRELTALKEQLFRLYEDVREGRIEPKIGAVANQILNTRLRMIALERDIREQEELAERIEALEHKSAVKKSRRWEAGAS